MTTSKSTTTATNDRNDNDKTTNNDNNEDNDDSDGGGQTPFLQVADSGGRHSRSRSLIRRGSKPKQKRGNESLTRNDCVIS